MTSIKHKMEYEIELLTPCFCGGAEPEEKAEIRAPSIRGQLRWWFRTLGGFKCLNNMSVREQEDFIFGSASKNHTKAGILQVRVDSTYECKRVSGKELGVDNPRTSDAYLLFSLRTQTDKQTKNRILQLRGVIDSKEDHTKKIKLLININKNRLTNVPVIDSINSINSLISLWINLGSLGMRGRRYYGALFSKDDNVKSIYDALKSFKSPHSICIKRLKNVNTGKLDLIQDKYVEWLKKMRTHGAKRFNTLNNKSPMWKYIKNDHDVAKNTLNNDINSISDKPIVYRPVLGLPIQTKTLFLNLEDAEYSQSKNNKKYSLEGHFASPVILRPYKDKEGKIHPLVIFVDSHKWPEGHKVYLQKPYKDAIGIDVSLDLYDAMKNDSSLEDFL